GLDPTGATLERSDDDHPSRWTELAVAEVPAAVSALLEDSGIDLAPARLEITGDEHALRLTPKQNRLAQAALAEGVPAEEAFRSVWIPPVRPSRGPTTTTPRGGRSSRWRRCPPRSPRCSRTPGSTSPRHGSRSRAMSTRCA